MVALLSSTPKPLQCSKSKDNEALFKIKFFFFIIEILNILKLDFLLRGKSWKRKSTELYYWMISIPPLEARPSYFLKEFVFQSYTEQSKNTSYSTPSKLKLYIFLVFC